jgi:hypothetical protein
MGLERTLYQENSLFILFGTCHGMMLLKGDGLESEKTIARFEDYVLLYLFFRDTCIQVRVLSSLTKCFDRFVPLTSPLADFLIVTAIKTTGPIFVVAT